ncbi:Major facilitator superfamily domain general substrate transporter [Fusarium albosuccineum]|uniref:Major facilitator superfamily domain general substrate transporter n=1 Tax=Fusarium albosuccineum TaxID=1237068 RepID=A0A8H4PAP2_9HYPO|nr:Major facilitator superfamily domain general substrate transporter [Fusarium albosuccineum]
MAANTLSEKERISASESPSDTVTVEELDRRIQELAKQATPFYRNPNLLRLYLLIIPGCLVPAVTLGYDSAMLNGLQAVPSWDEYFNRPRGSILGLLNAVLGLGCIIATPLISMVGDRWGRRMGIFVGAVIMLIGGIIQGASVHIAMFLISRFVIGFGLVFANTYAPMLIGELAHPKDRQVATSLYQTSWYLGAVTAAWTTFGTFSIGNNWAWRIPSYLQAAPALVQIIGVWCLPESPRFLIAKGRPEQAKAILVKYHAEDDASSEFVDLEYRQMRAVIEAEIANATGWKFLLQTPGNRRRVLVLVLLGLFSQWSGNGLVSYYLARVLETVGITDARDANIINGCLMIFNWLTSVASAFASGRLKRRTQFLISVIGMLLVFSSQTLCAGLFNERGIKAAGHGVIAMLFLFYVFFNFAFNALLYSYPVEVLPYPIRAKGFSILMFFGKSAGFINAFVNPIGLQALAWKYYGVYVGWLCVEVACVYLFFPETSGRSLEAVAQVFDGKVLADADKLAVA